MDFMDGLSQEDLFNRSMGTVLGEMNAQWQSKSGSPILVEKTRVIRDRDALKPDVLVCADESPPIVIEASYNSTDADQDAIARLGLVTKRHGMSINTAIAVVVPLMFRHDDRSNTEAALRGGHYPLKYAMYQRTRRLPEQGYYEGCLDDMNALLNAAMFPKELVDKVTNDVAGMVIEAARRLGDIPESRRRKLAMKVHQRTPLTGMQTIAVLWLNAMLVQQRLYRQGIEDIPPLPTGNYSESVSPRGVYDTWQKILEVNWHAIFQPAVRVLQSAGETDAQATAWALGHLVQAAQLIEQERMGPHVHIGAELFPRLSQDRKTTAAFYTQAPTAELLAALTIRRDDRGWGGNNPFNDLRIADLACGTGTLLRAAYLQVRNFHATEGGDAESVKALHKSAMEKGLIGTDISPIAAHFASASLAALGSGEPYGEDEIGWVDVGGANGQTGALEFLNKDHVVDMFTRRYGQATGHVDADKRSIAVGEGSMDYVIMNPPYSTTRGGQAAFDIAGLSAKDRMLCQTNWGKQLKGKAATKRAGMAASFVAMAREKVKRGGRIGFVLPMSAALGDIWTITRAMLERDFEDIVAVAVSAGKALGKNALSADTNMEEMLLVATRKRGLHFTPSPIKCVTLYNAPTILGEAAETGRAILEAIPKVSGMGDHCPIHSGDTEVGMVTVFETDGSGAPWSALGATRPDLASAAVALAHGKIVDIDGDSVSLGIEMSIISNVLEMGPTHMIIGYPKGKMSFGAFEFSPVISATDAIGPDRSMWEANSKTQKQLVVTPTHKGIVVNPVSAPIMRNRGSTLFYARGMGWTSQALLAATTRQKVMGGRTWASLGHTDSRVLKAAALWFNSTFGLIVHWTHASRSQTGRAPTQIRGIEKMPCPRFDLLPDIALNDAVIAFDRFALCELKPACQAHCDEVRKSLDRAVANILTLSDYVIEELETLRYLWCREPSVHGNNKTALRLLAK